MSADVDVRGWSAADLAALLVDGAPDVEYRRGAAARHEAGRVDYIVAIRGDEIVGSGELTTDDPPELKNLWVDSGERGSGIGTSIIDFAERLVERRAAATASAHAERCSARATLHVPGNVRRAKNESGWHPRVRACSSRAKPRCGCPSGCPRAAGRRWATRVRQTRARGRRGPR
ncbi:MAG: GNAT family N-acetyltransferase [Microcella sp.]